MVLVSPRPFNPDARPSPSLGPDFDRFISCFEGLLIRYLQLSSLGFLLGDTLVVHGALREISLG